MERNMHCIRENERERKNPHQHEHKGDLVRNGAAAREAHFNSNCNKLGGVSVTNHQADPPRRWSFRPPRSRDTRGCSPTQSEQPSAPQH